MRFTKAQHFQHTGLVTTENVFYPIRFTVLSRIEGDTVHYKVSYCSRNEPAYVKSVGVQQAQQSDEFTVDTPSEITSKTVSDAILRDLASKHLEEMPRQHRRYFISRFYGFEPKVKAVV